MKQCAKCREMKPLSAFYANSGMTDGRLSACKTCVSTARKARYLANLDVERERNRERNARHRAKHPEQVRARRREWYRANSVIANAAAKARRDRNIEMARARERGWRARNRGLAVAAARAYKERDPEKHRAMRQAINGRRRQREAHSGGHGITGAQWRERISEFGHTCAYCLGGGPLAMEHLDALFVGGVHDMSNVVPSCRRCNSAKGTLTVLEYLTGFRLTPTQKAG